jgi:NADP-reducing hydrogenase subunit HndC
MPTPLERLADMRRKAVFRLYHGKFKADMRVTVGSATCENAAGAEAVHDRFRERLKGLDAARIALGRVGCAGRCDLEPVVTVTGPNAIPVKYVRMTPERVDQVVESHLLGGKPVEAFTMQAQTGAARARHVISLCGGAGCLKRGSPAVEQAFVEALAERGLSDQVAVMRSGCHGLCEAGPIAHVYPDGVVYREVTPDLARRIVAEHLAGRKPVAEAVWTGSRVANRFVPLFGDVHFFAKQLRLTLRNCGVIDPESIYEYLAVRGYEALARALDGMSPAEVVEAVLRSGLRGRGGAGFPTGLKWKIAAEQPGEEKYVICNADEGDPGAFMDRSTIEGDPHTVLEGLALAGYAVGARKGFVYIRAEYPLAVRRLEKAIEIATAAGFLGKGIMGSDFDFDIEIRLGAGAFVCGEETALIRSIEGERGMPSPRPPYPPVCGLWDKPTVINNVETLANVPVVILDGPDWFRSIGTAKSKGTKVFALAGKVRNTGLIEVPMGTTLREVVYEVGGGIPNDRGFKAIQTGGPAGGCLPESALDTPVDYESLAAAGSIMGSGGMIVMDEDTCMVDVARFFLEFTQDESCGKCTPCREGTKRMLEILQRITSGQGREGDVEILARLADTVRRASLCGLGQAAPNPVLSTIKHFRAEYDAHIRDKRCPARVCRQLVRYEVDAKACVGCGACRRKCPAACITGKPKTPHVIDQAACIRCGACFQVCKFNAITRS